MKIGHEFHPEHGFTGSAHPTTEFRPTVPGFKRGGHMPKEGAAEEAGETGPIENMKHGGLAHVKGHHKNYAHGGKAEHDKHPKHDSHGAHDKHGFHVHKGHKE